MNQKKKEKKRGTISKSEIFCHSAQPSTYEPVLQKLILKCGK
jgi:hypothetical protein